MTNQLITHRLPTNVIDHRLVMSGIYIFIRQLYFDNKPCVFDGEEFGLNIEVNKARNTLCANHTDATTLKGVAGSFKVTPMIAEPHTYRTHAFIFSWSLSSAAYGSRARTYDDDDVIQHGAPTGQPMQHRLQYACNLILEIHFKVK